MFSTATGKRPSKAAISRVKRKRRKRFCDMGTANERDSRALAEECNEATDEEEKPVARTAATRQKNEHKDYGAMLPTHPGKLQQNSLLQLYFPRKPSAKSRTRKNVKSSIRKEKYDNDTATKTFPAPEASSSSFFCCFRYVLLC